MYGDGISRNSNQVKAWAGSSGEGSYRTGSGWETNKWINPQTDHIWVNPSYDTYSVEPVFPIVPGDPGGNNLIADGIIYPPIAVVWPNLEPAIPLDWEPGCQIIALPKDPTEKLKRLNELVDALSAHEKLVKRERMGRLLRPIEDIEATNSYFKIVCPETWQKDGIVLELEYCTRDGKSLALGSSAKREKFFKRTR
jgi:hypothetical protein